VYLRISGVLVSGAVVGVMLTLTRDPRRDMFDAFDPGVDPGVAASRTAAARPPPDGGDAPKPYAWNELLP